MTKIVKFDNIFGMKLSTKSTYGLRAMLTVALEAQRGAVSIMDIARREGISISYLEQLLNKLKHEGLVESIRGPKGGYVLSKNPDRITVGQVVKVLEGGISPVYCITPRKDHKDTCDRIKSCATKIVWARLAKAMNDCLESMTLEDLCVEARRIGHNLNKRRAKFGGLTG